MVKVQILVGQHPVPARGLVGVEGGGLIALALGQGGQGGHALLHIELIGHGVGGLEQSGEAGEVLKFHAGGAAAGDGGVHPALDGVLLHGVEEGGGVLRGLKGIKNGKIGKGLVHDDHDVGRAGDGAAPLLSRVLLHQLQHRVVGVALRLVHRAVPHGHGEVEKKAVALGDPLLGVDVQGGQHPGAEKGVGVAPHGGPKQQAPPQRQPGPLLLGDAHPHQEQVGGQQHRRLDDILVEGVVKAAGHIGGGPPPRDVRREQDAAPEAKNIVVEQAGQEGQHRPQGGSPPVPSQHQAADGEQAVIPHHVHQHLPGLQVPEHVILI